METRKPWALVRNSGRTPKLPHGYYLSDYDTMDIRVDEPAASAIREIFKLYIKGWGYKKIAEYMNETYASAPKARKTGCQNTPPAEKVNWSISSVERILKMDFYLGTYRQEKIGEQGTGDQSPQVIVNHHDPIVDYRTYILAKSLLQKRAEFHYRGQKKYDHLYSGFLYCGDCGSPMFAVSRRDLAPAYTCGTYHRCGTRGCSAHHIRTDRINCLLMSYLQETWRASQAGIEQTQAFLSTAKERVADADRAIQDLLRARSTAKRELKLLMLQNIRNENPDGSAESAVISETIDLLAQSAADNIVLLSKKLGEQYTQRNAWIRCSRAAQTAMDVFQETMKKQIPSKDELELLLDRIVVSEDRVEFLLKPDVSAFLNGIIGPKTTLQELNMAAKEKAAALYA